MLKVQVAKYTGCFALIRSPSLNIYCSGGGGLDCFCGLELKSTWDEVFVGSPHRNTTISYQAWELSMKLKMSAAVNLHFMEKNNCLQEKAIGGTTITQKQDKKRRKHWF